MRDLQDLEKDFTESWRWTEEFYREGATPRWRKTFSGCYLDWAIDFRH